MRTCSMCKESKPDGDFAFKSKATGRRQGYCRECHKGYRRQHYVNNRAKYIRKAKVRSLRVRDENRASLVEYFREHPCVDCGESDLRVLEFDHRDNQTKSFTISAVIADSSWVTIETEIQKCDVRCCNCHRKRTIRQFGWWRDGTLV